MCFAVGQMIVAQKILSFTKFVWNSLRSTFRAPSNLQKYEIEAIESKDEPQGGGDGGDDLGNQAVEVGVRGPADLQVVLAEVVDCLRVTTIVPMNNLLYH